MIYYTHQVHTLYSCFHGNNDGAVCRAGMPYHRDAYGNHDDDGDHDIHGDHAQPSYCDRPACSTYAVWRPLRPSVAVPRALDRIRLVKEINKLDHTLGRKFS